MSDQADALARLRAGLDRDEALANAAAERAAEWRSDGSGVEGGPFDPGDPEWGIPWSGEHTIVYDEGWPKPAEAIHIAQHDPARVLRQVKRLRAIADLCENLAASDVVFREIPVLLADIFDEDTAETGAQA